MDENNNQEIAIQLQGVKKRYKLGQIGGGTLQGDLQSWWARVRGKEDPNTIIGTDQQLFGKIFMALNGIDLKIYKGERIGIIGHNGAGKSTLLKLLSRVTAPTEGEIDIYGRIASMLEVGTGFNGEMTGRENVYMNGVILGMTKKEIDAKMEDIIEFSECRQFIDTPVKRYSSGMYVKLAFSVAAHLDSEIMIMDEVLAVGDMAFQKKCLDKMSDVSKTQGRTILYVSHNMNTIRQLCDRVIVLDHGKIIYDGKSEKGIEVYLHEATERKPHNDFTDRKYDKWITTDVKIIYLDVLSTDNLFLLGDKIQFSLDYECKRNINQMSFRFTILTPDRTAVATAHTELFSSFANNRYHKDYELDISHIAPGDYQMQIVAFEPSGDGNQIRHDYVSHAVAFSVYSNDKVYNLPWSTRAWGFQTIEVKSV